MYGHEPLRLRLEGLKHTEPMPSAFSSTLIVLQRQPCYARATEQRRFVPHISSPVRLLPEWVPIKPYKAEIRLVHGLQNWDWDRPFLRDETFRFRYLLWPTPNRARTETPYSHIKLRHPHHLSSDPGPRRKFRNNKIEFPSAAIVSRFSNRSSAGPGNCSV